MTQPDQGRRGPATTGTAESAQAPAESAQAPVESAQRPAETAAPGQPAAGPPAPGPAAGPPAAPPSGARRSGSGPAAPGGRPSPSPSAAKAAAAAAASSAVRAVRSGAAATPGTRPGGPRRARLALRRIDPFSVLRLSLVLSLALFVVGLVAVGVLYSVLEGMGVPEAVNSTVNEVTAGAGGEAGIGDVLTLRRVLTVTAVLGAANAVILTALATLGAFLYNLCADVVGGIEVTLAEHD